MIPQLKKQLEQGLCDLNLSIPHDIITAFIDYIFLLEKWNKVYALTAIDKPHEMVVKHILDSLVISPYLHGMTIADIGTGAGLPGIPLALCYPDRHFTLVDSQRKKIQFLIHAQQLLPLKNVSIVHCRAENFKPERCFDTILSRAFASLDQMLAVTRHLCCDAGQILAMKGQYPDDELKAIPNDIYEKKIHKLHVPGLDANRHLVVLQKKGVA